MNEYQKLLQRYGVSSQQLPYAGLAKPTDTAAPEYEDLMSKYTADRSAYDKWLDAYKKRIASRSVYDPAFTGEILGIPVYEYGAGYTLPKAPTKSVASPAAAPAAFVEPQQAGGAGNYSGSSAPPGGGYGIPGATLVGGISGPTTGLASLANSTAAYLGNLSIDPITGQQKSGPLASIARGISDAIAKNVDPNFSHEGAPGKGTGTVDGITKTDLGSFIIGPTGLTPITAPATEESQTRLDAITGKAAAEAQAAMEAQAQREAANMAARAQAEREAQAQREASIPTGVTGVDPNAGEGGVGGVGAGGYSGGYDGGYGGGYDGGDPGGGGPRAKGGVIGRTYARGGAVRRNYAGGGLTDLAGRYGIGSSGGPPDTYQSADMSRELEAPEPQPMASNEDVMAMFNKYQTPQQPVSPYAQELVAARKTAAEQTEAFNTMLQKAISEPGEAAPSKAELYFQLAAAFGAPTRTGSFTESLGKAGEVMGEQQKAQRAAQKAQRTQALTLGLEGQKMKMQTAKEDLNTLRTLAGEEMKDVRATNLADLQDRRARDLADLVDKRARDLEALRERYKAGAPASEAGKMAADAGLVRGTPEFNKFVNKYIDDKMSQGNEYKAIMASIAQQGLDLRKQAGDRAAEQAKKLTPQEMKLKTDTEDMLAQTDQSLASLKQAYALNPNTFDASTVDVVQRKALEAVGSKDPKVVNTREMENLLEKAALSQLKSTFPGAISNDERKALQDVQGLSSKSKEERAKIMKNGYTALKSVRERAAKRLNEINQGLYRDTTPATGEIE